MFSNFDSLNLNNDLRANKDGNVDILIQRNMVNFRSLSWAVVSIMMSKYFFLCECKCTIKEYLKNCICRLTGTQFYVSSLKDALR